MLGSFHDAEGALQETLVAAWQGLDGFERRSSLRTWLYRIATSRCLNARRARDRRPRPEMSPPELNLPEVTYMLDVAWLEPYPDVLVEGLADRLPGPEARYEAREAISLAFLTALQLMPPRQRAVLILRDVLEFHASEVARILASTEESVTSALKRARATLQQRLPPAGEHEPLPPPDSAAERELVEWLTLAFEAGDVDGIVALLAEDVRITMPPVEYRGREAASRFLALTAVTYWQGGGPRLVLTRANGQSAFGLYVRDPRAWVSHTLGLLVVTLAGNRISAITRFDTSVLPRFGLPRTLPD